MKPMANGTMMRFQRTALVLMALGTMGVGACDDEIVDLHIVVDAGSDRAAPSDGGTARDGEAGAVGAERAEEASATSDDAGEPDAGD
jgi:hypothetical protein